jgi:hypothetical protein
MKAKVSSVMPMNVGIASPMRLKMKESMMQEAR